MRYGSHWLSLPLSGILWPSLAHYCVYSPWSALRALARLSAPMPRWRTFSRSGLWQCFVIESLNLEYTSNKLSQTCNDWRQLKVFCKNIKIIVTNWLWKMMTLSTSILKEYQRKFRKFQYPCLCLPCILNKPPPSICFKGVNSILLPKKGTTCLLEFHYSTVHCIAHTDRQSKHKMFKHRGKKKVSTTKTQLK